MPKQAKTVLVISIIESIAVLFLFKYTDFFIQMVNMFSIKEIPLIGIALPAGISFYTFQIMSYTIDVYRGRVEAQKNIIDFAMYVCMFPQLIAGPVVRYEQVAADIHGRKLEWQNIALGFQRFVTGLGKKVIFANMTGALWEDIYNASAADTSVLLAWLGAVAYTFQIYFDFSGYSDMAIGIARMFGFTYLENFNYPFTSTSIQEFWRKWHISLSTWFKEYLYIPLGGNRKGRPRTVFNKFMIFFCCGLWHGAAWTFVVWGLIHGFFLLLEEYLPIRKLPKPVGWVYAMLVVMLAFVLFRADTFEQGLHFLSQMFVGWGPLTSEAQVLLMGQLTPLFLFTLVLGAVGSFPWLPKLKERLATLSVPAQHRADALASVACLGLLVLCLVTLAGGAYSPFIYFRF